MENKVHLGSPPGDPSGDPPEDPPGDPPGEVREDPPGDPPGGPRGDSRGILLGASGWIPWGSPEKIPGVSLGEPRGPSGVHQRCRSASLG